jgi:hypothetical protein
VTAEAHLLTYEAIPAEELDAIRVLVADGRQAEGVIAEPLARPEVELVHLRNVSYGCYNFSVRAVGTDGD